MNWTYRLTQVLWDGLDWLYPPICGGCGKPGYRWCPDCQRQVMPVPEPVCRICGQPQKNSGICPACRIVKPSFTALRSWVVFEGPIRKALHHLKYRRNIALGDALAHPLTEFVQSFHWPVDTVVPVPLGRKRLQERGYNQASLIACPLAALAGWQYQPRALIRSRETRSQVGLTPMERQENVRGAFYSNPGKISGKRVLLVDDVATTGATMESCSETVLASGAKVVYALTIARALPHSDLKII